MQRNEGTGHPVGDQHARHGRRGKALSGRAFLEDCREVGNKAILGLDAHCVRHIQDMDSYRKCMELVEKYNLNLINKLEL